jgi:uncharacterized protein (DUF983 family)
LCDKGARGQIGSQLFFGTGVSLADILGVAMTLSPAVPEGERATMPALIKGWRCKCPSCGTGPMMRGYLTVRDTCPVCGEELHHHRADDGPAYLTILIVGHVMAPLLLAVFTRFRPEPATLIAIFSVFTVALSLYLLPRLKGAMVALQWAKRMHGFGAPLAADGI